MVVNPQTLNMLPLYDYYAAIVYAMQPNNIQHVFVNGDLKVKDSKLVHTTEEDVIQKFSVAYDIVEAESRELLKKATQSE